MTEQTDTERIEASLQDEFDHYQLGFGLITGFSEYIEDAELKLNALNVILNSISSNLEWIKRVGIEGEAGGVVAAVFSLSRELRSAVAAEYGLAVYGTYDEQEDEDEDYDF